MKEKGFTLIELSIVFVIIGLIVEGVLVGQDLIKAAQIRSTISSIEQTNTASNAFRLKYNCLAGDCGNATTFFSAATQPEQTMNGNNNKIITYDSTFATGYLNGYEQSFFYDHLALAGLVSLAPFDENSVSANTAGEGFVKTPIGTGLVVGTSSADNLHKYLLGSTYDAGNDWQDTETPNISAPDAYAIDAKLDDGKPLSGTVIAAERADGGPEIFDNPDTPGASGVCVTTATGNPYSFDASDMCALQIRASF